MRSNPGLKHLYRRWNRRWFGERLPDAVIVSWDRRIHDKERCLGLIEQTPGQPQVISLAWEIRPFDCLTRVTLLHEMVHLYIIYKYPQGTRVHHGPIFQGEMLGKAEAREILGKIPKGLPAAGIK